MKIKIKEIENAVFSTRILFADPVRYTVVIDDNLGPWEKYTDFLLLPFFFALFLATLLPEEQLGCQLVLVTWIEDRLYF